MTRPPTDREALIAALAEQARSDVASEPEPEELLAYLAGGLAPEDERRVDRQLAASPEAARALLDLVDFEAAGAAAGTQPAELAVRAGWRDLRGRLSAGGSWAHQLPPLLSAVAASLLVTTLGLSVWVGRLQSEMSRPIANVKSLDLVSESRAAGEEVVKLAPGKPLRVVLPPAEDCPAYQAELGQPGGEHWTLEDLRKDASGNLTLELPRPAPGLYRLLLFGCEPRRELEEHRFRIVRPDPAQPEADGD